MVDLHLTPTRIELMLAIQNGEVWQSWEGDCPIILENEDGQRKVTARADELGRAGYARVRGGHSEWLLTDKGQDALNAALEATCPTCGPNGCAGHTRKASAS